MEREISNMRLIYIYFDFTRGGNYLDGYRGYRKCGFHFGTSINCAMAEPADEHSNYTLHISDLSPGEEIVPGFWGDKRIFNITALVGDNGAGKSTILHEIIRCTQDLIHGTETRNSEYVMLFQDHNSNYHLASSVKQYVDVRFSGREKTINLQSLPQLVAKMKQVYFSNALTMSDLTLFTQLTGLEADIYSQPFFDCSLSSDIINAIKISIGENKANDYTMHTTMPDALEIYFNFRSYQEARYVFDRSQRQALIDLREKYEFPVPVPKALTLLIKPAVQNLCVHIFENYIKEQTEFRYIFDGFLIEYQEYTGQLVERTNMRGYILLAELCLNCIACFAAYIAKEYGRERVQVAPPFLPFDNRDFYLSYLGALKEAALCDSNPNAVENAEVVNFHKICENYVNFLWNQKSYIFKHFKNIRFDYVPISSFLENNEAPKTISARCVIPLNDPIDSVLEELMIRFINLTRSVSKTVYFVVYNWGLSSGESNLLHLFTKLRYLLHGPVYDEDTPIDVIPDPIEKNNYESNRQDYLQNCIKDQTDKNPVPYVCDCVMILIDEADLTLHPEWQRIFVAVLSEFLPKLFKDPYYSGTDTGCKDIQVILGTHSPIMLGDFPGTSVIYLQKNEDGSIDVKNRSSLKTFGENIYTILNDGFYLQNGAIGELARQKINAVLEDISKLREEIRIHEKDKSQSAPDPKEWSEKLERHRRITIQHLSEGIIKNQLTAALDQLQQELSADADWRANQIQLLDDQIEELQQRRKNLKKRKNRKRRKQDT